MDQQTPTAPTVVVSAPSTRNLPAWLTPTTFTIGGAVLIALAAILAPNLGLAAIVAGIACFVVAILAIIFLLITPARADRVQLGVTTAVLVIIGVVAILSNGAAYQYAITRDQANGNYAGAATAQRALGQKPPYSTDLATTYLNWSNAEIKNNAFASAVDHLNYVIANFPTLPQAATAQMLLPGTYLQWAQFATGRNDSITAGQAYQYLLTHFGSSAAAGQAASTAPAAFLAWGDAAFAAQHNDDAVTAYQLITKYYPKSPEATKAHSQTAKALAVSSKQLADAHRYGEAYEQYTLLAKSYADTPEGVAAKKLLTQGVQLIGRLVKADGQTPVTPYTTVRLSSKWTVTGSGSSLSYIASGTQYYAGTDTNGYFVFPSVPSGPYLLEWRNTTGVFLTYFNGAAPLDIITLHPLENQTLPTIVTNFK
ncbi:MAG: hypothetical protein H0X24_12685 [Ktedonobacterales bacterium]|nr:hypothetical protein [Ktedonobacterales bacterium]